MAKTLDDYLTEITTLAGDRDLSIRWYREQIKKVIPPKLEEGSGTDYRMTFRGVHNIIREGIESRPTYGILNLYMYDPKLKEKLDYYDVFPLVIPIEKSPGGFIGINFHYLSIPLRLKLMEQILPMTAPERIIGWNRVAMLRLVRPCVKRYLTRHVKTRFVLVQDDKMPIAAMMPLQRFKKERARRVYELSRMMLR